MELLLLLSEQLLEGPLHLGAEDGQPADVAHGHVDQTLVEGEDHEEGLDVHLDDGLADQGGPEEGPEGDQEVAAGDPRQVEQRVGNLD